jgi:outer membrane protein OmpA-like peptidoglycan-associated protein
MPIFFSRQFSRNSRAVLFILWLFIVSGPLFAQDYQAKMERSDWYVSSSIFECSLVHDVPRYGQGIFYHEAGEALSFYTSAVSNPMAEGKAALVIEASNWRPGQAIRDLGYVRVRDGERPLIVESKRARHMIDGLMDGMKPTFTRKAWFSDEAMRVSLNSINFNKAYQGFRSCEASLLPVNFRQVERTKVLFEVDKARLLARDINILDNLITYVKADSTVTSIFVDGYTDSSGRKIYNRKLSKKRAEVVTKYLMDAGLDQTIIQTRYHGERYPIAENNSTTNKAKNRRTTVRLEKGVRRIMGDVQDDTSPVTTANN